MPSCGQQPHALVYLWSTEARPAHYFVVGCEHFAPLYEIGGVLCRCDNISCIAKEHVLDFLNVSTQERQLENAEALLQHSKDPLDCGYVRGRG